jgi:hypothetical protein
MEQLQLDRQAMTGEMFALKDAAATDGIEFIGFDSLPLVEIDPTRDEDISAAVAIPPKPVRRRRAKVHTRPHSVLIWLDDGELLQVTEGADAAGVALPDYLRARALNDPKADARPAECIPDLFLPVASPPAVPAPVIAQLSPELEERINVYYASGDRLDLNAISYGWASGGLKRLNGFSRLGHILAELFGVRSAGYRALPRGGA